MLSARSPVAFCCHKRLSSVRNDNKRLDIQYAMSVLARAPCVEVEFQMRLVIKSTRCLLLRDRVTSDVCLYNKKTATLHHVLTSSRAADPAGSFTEHRTATLLRTTSRLLGSFCRLYMVWPQYPNLLTPDFGSLSFSFLLSHTHHTEARRSTPDAIHPHEWTLTICQAAIIPASQPFPSVAQSDCGFMLILPRLILHVLR